MILFQNQKFWKNNKKSLWLHNNKNNHTIHVIKKKRIY